MNIIDIFKGIEKLVVQLLLLLIYLPKTIVKIIKSPGWVPEYINEENKKPDGYKDYVSPVMLYLILTVLLFSMIFGPGGDNSKGGIEELIESLKGVSGAIIALGFLSIPLYGALIIVLFSSAKSSKDNIIRLLYIQCYYFAPLVLALFGYFLVIKLFLDSSIIRTESEQINYQIPLFIISAIILIWFVKTEVRFISIELKTGFWKSFGLIIIGIVFSLIIFVKVFDTGINNNPKGEPERISFKLSESGEYKININCSNDSFGEFDLSLTPKNDSLVNYPHKGVLNFNEKIIGRLPFSASNDRTDSHIKKTRPHNEYMWEITASKEENLIIIARPFPFETQKRLLIQIADSSGKIVTKSMSSYPVFKPTYNGIIKINVSAINDSIEFMNYELAVVLENSYLYGLKANPHLEQKTMIKRSATLYDFINDSIKYPENGTIIPGQKISAFLNKSGNWIINGEVDKEYTVIVAPQDPRNTDFDPMIDILNASNTSIFFFGFLPIIITFIYGLLFVFPFSQSLYAFFKKLVQDQNEDDNEIS